MQFEDVDVNDLPDLLAMPWSNLLSALASFRDDHGVLLAKCIENCVPNGAIGHLVIAALKRSDALLDGFVSLVDSRNRFSAVPLIRMQLDSAMRVHACGLVSDSDAFVKHILEGNEPRKYANKPQLSDKFLHEQLTEKYPFTSDLYRDTNGFIHLSNHHLFGIFNWDELQDGEFVLTDHECLPSWSEELRKGDVVSMIWATHVLTEECQELLKDRLGGTA